MVPVKGNGEITVVAKGQFYSLASLFHFIRINIL